MQRGTPTSDRIGSYNVLRQLSVMGAVQVHLGQEEGPGGFSRNVTLKVVPKASGLEADDTEELIREATACAKLTHPCIVRTRQVFEHDNAVVLVLEHVDGISLADLLARRGTDSRRAFSDDAALHIGLSLCDALAHAHAVLDKQGVRVTIVHRAVNPSNILIGRDGTVKLDGFGFAKISGGVATRRADVSTWTPAYLAPEQITEQPPTPKIDVYAVGLILWELLTGRSATTLPRDPFAIEATMKAVAERSPAPLATLRPDIPEELSAAVDAALVSAPDRRTINCAEMARTIRRVCLVASGKMELRERVQTELAAAPPGSRADRAGEPSARTNTPARVALAPPHRPPAFHRTLAGLAPPAPDAPPAVDELAALAATASSGSLPALAATVGALQPEFPPPPSRADIVPEVESAELLPTEPATTSPDPGQVAPSSDQVSPSGVVAWSSLVKRLNAPTPWRRNTWLAAWVVLLIGFGGLVARLSFSRASTSFVASAPNVPSRQATAAQASTPRAETPAAEAPAPAEAPIETEARPVSPGEPASIAPGAPSAIDEPSTQQMMRRGLGYLTVHSSAARANVYINLKSYGGLEEKLMVPCGKRFVSIGIPAHHPTKTVWLAPGKTIVIPCAGTYEATMNPRALR